MSFEGSLMVFSLWHLLPSALSALLIIALAILGRQGGHSKSHKRLSFAMALFAALGLAGYLNQGNIIFYPNLQENASSILPEKEASEYRGKRLVPISEQGNNGISGTQHLDRESLRLNVTGLVRNDLSFSYQDLLAFPAYTELAYMPCVEGWDLMLNGPVFGCQIC
jgi:hypothetical protein